MGEVTPAVNPSWVSDNPLGGQYLNSSHVAGLGPAASKALMHLLMHPSQCRSNGMSRQPLSHCRGLHKPDAWVNLENIHHAEAAEPPLAQPFLKPKSLETKIARHNRHCQCPCHKRFQQDAVFDGHRPRRSLHVPPLCPGPKCVCPQQCFSFQV